MNRENSDRRQWRPSEKQEVHVVDFVIHPDFGFPQGHEATEKDQRFLDAITRRARFLAWQGLMFYCIEDFKQFEQSDTHHPIQQHVQVLRKQLRDRLVLVPAEYDITHPGTDIHGPLFNEARDQAKHQGYTFTEEAAAYAYGRTCTVCVPIAGSHAQRHFRFRNRIRAIVGLTDYEPEKHQEWMLDAMRAYPDVEFEPLNSTRR